MSEKIKIFDTTKFSAYTKFSKFTDVGKFVRLVYQRFETKSIEEFFMKTPTHLKHKPIIEVTDYDGIDGPYAGNSDAKCLSLGVAQWNDGMGTTLSAKVWRQSDGRWSRQSEELPLHRVIDLATLVCEAESSALGNSLVSSSEFPVSKVSDSSVHHQILKSEFEKNKNHLDKSLIRLANALKKLGY